MFRLRRVAGTRELVAYPNYVIIYRLTDDAIEVVNMVHARQHYPRSRVFFELAPAVVKVTSITDAEARRAAAFRPPALATETMLLALERAAGATALPDRRSTTTPVPAFLESAMLEGDIR